MKKKLFNIGIAGMLFGAAAIVGNIETDQSVVLPIVIFIIGILLILTNKKGAEEFEKENYIDNSNHVASRPKFLR